MRTCSHYHLHQFQVILPWGHVAAFRPSPALWKNDVDVQMTPLSPAARTVVLLGCVVGRSEKRLLESGTRLGNLHVAPGMNVVFGPVSLMPVSDGAPESEAVESDDHFDESGECDDKTRDPDYIPLERGAGYKTVAFRHILRKRH